MTSLQFQRAIFEGVCRSSIIIQLTVFSNGLESPLQDVIVDYDVEEADAVEIADAVEWGGSNGQQYDQEQCLHSKNVDT